MHDLGNRDLRQRDILPPDKLAQLHASVIGVGAIGRQVALGLAAIGTGRLTLIDFDHVAPENLAVQGFLESDLGEPKVTATAEMCRRINGTIGIDTVNGRFNSRLALGQVVFCCVDSIETRRRIWQCVKDRCGLFIDTRMAAEVVRVLSASGEPSRRHYGTTLFGASEAYRGACTARTTLYAAQLAGALAIGQLGKFLRHLLLEADVIFNMLTCELQVQEI